MVHTPETKGSARPSELRSMVSLAIPVVFVQLGFTAMGAVDTLMVGRISATMLAAVALGNLYFMGVAFFCIGTLMALDPLVAQAIGAGDKPAVSRAMQRGLVIAVGLSILCILALVPAGPFLRLLHQPPTIAPVAANYVRISIAGVLPFLAFVVLRQSLQAMHRPAAIVWTILLANLVNAGLNWVFVYGNLGFPPMGATGSAIATAIGRWLMSILLLAFAWRDLKPNLFPWRPDILEWASLKRMLKLGLPIGAQQALEAGAFSAIGLLMGVLGATEMAAHQIAITLASLTFMVPLGVATAAAVRVGHAIGAGDEPRARAAIRAAYLCGVGFMSLTGAAFLLVPGIFARAFTNDSSVIALASVLIPIAGVFQVFDGGQAVGAGVLRGAGDTTAPLFTMLAAYWLVGVPVSAYLGFQTDLRAAGLWWGFVASLGVVAVFLLLRIRVVFGRGVRPVERVATPSGSTDFTAGLRRPTDFTD